MRLFFVTLISVSLFVLSSCAPVKFSKSDNERVNVDAPVVDTNTVKILCQPRINETLLTYKYDLDSGVLPKVSSSCNQSNLNYEWIIKKADATVLGSNMYGLTGSAPAAVDLTVLGEGTYYVTLKATDKDGKKETYDSTSLAPLEFIVPGKVVLPPMACNPVLGTTSGAKTEVEIVNNAANPSVSANCAPPAGQYIWSVKKDGVDITLPGLSGDSSTPDFKGYGQGTYLISLYATSTSTTHWRSTTPLKVVVKSVVVPPTPIACTPRINGTQTSITLAGAAANPLISALCMPSDVAYKWRVTKNGYAVNMTDLTGANSNPNFSAQGVGTYLVYLEATKTGFTTWSSTQPLTVTVESLNPNLNVNCSPRLNGDKLAVTITPTSNPLSVMAGCTPSDVTYSWLVQKNGVNVNVPTLTGAISNPNFISQGLGTYYIYLTASKTGMNSFVTATPLAVTVSEDEKLTRAVEFTKTVQVSDNKVDLLVVFDDSNSMLKDNLKLAQRLSGFVSNLASSQLDWQMCTTVTRAEDVRGDGVYYWGSSKDWVNYVGSEKWILKMGATDPSAIFKATVEKIGAGWLGTDDERGIKAAFWHAEYAAYNKCYRNDASLSVIMISDEDVRSVGGDSNQAYYANELKPLDSDDLPQSYVNKIKQKFGQTKRFTVNSIIVKPNDVACMSAQDAEGAKSHYGVHYKQLSDLTNGYVGSICDADFTNNLNIFKDKIVNSMNTFPLECTPTGSVDVSVTPSMGGIYAELSGQNLIVKPTIPAGHTIKIKYLCPQN